MSDSNSDSKLEKNETLFIDKDPDDIETPQQIFPFEPQDDIETPQQNFPSEPQPIKNAFGMIQKFMAAMVLQMPTHLFASKKKQMN